MVLAILLGVAVLTSVASAVVNVVFDVSNTPEWWVGWLQNFSTEMFGAFLTFVLLELVVGVRQEKERLVVQLRSQDKSTALNAIDMARDNGMLEDGTLRRSRLISAKLDGANLKLADLSYSHFRHGDLSGAGLGNTNLSHTTWIGASLEGADLGGANLDSADLGGANLGGAKLHGASLEGADLGGAKFSEDTILPDGSEWTPDITEAEWSERFGVVFKTSAEKFEELDKMLGIKRRSGNR